MYITMKSRYSDGRFIFHIQDGKIIETDGVDESFSELWENMAFMRSSHATLDKDGGLVTVEVARKPNTDYEVLECLRQIYTEQFYEIEVSN